MSNSAEKLVVSSASVLCIDQFMLANAQCRAACQQDPEKGAAAYDGLYFEFPNGEYEVFRDPQLQIVAIAPENATECTSEEGLGAVIESFGPGAESGGKLRIDTRCLVISDGSLLQNAALLDEFAELRRAGKDKEARDLLRANGAAVRYGFNKWGDELTLFSRGGAKPLAALWPE